MYGLDGDDTLNGRAGNDLIEGGAGVDTVYGGVGEDDLSGGSGDDKIYGNNPKTTTADGSTDFIYGGGGKDTIYLAIGGYGEVYAGLGADTIYAGETTGKTSDGTEVKYAGEDDINAGYGSDTIYAKDGKIDVVNCGRYESTTSYESDNDIAYLDSEDFRYDCEDVRQASERVFSVNQRAGTIRGPGPLFVFGSSGSRQGGSRGSTRTRREGSSPPRPSRTRSCSCGPLAK